MAGLPLSASASSWCWSRSQSTSLPAASASSGLAEDPTHLMLSRALPGRGAAVPAPQALRLLMPLFPVEKPGGLFATYGVTAGLAGTAGPTGGGCLVTHFG